MHAPQLGLSIDDDGADDDDLPPLEADVPGQDEGSRMEVSAVLPMSSKCKFLSQKRWHGCAMYGFSLPGRPSCASAPSMHVSKLVHTFHFAASELAILMCVQRDAGSGV